MIQTDIEFSKIALAHYDNPSCVDIREFQDDLKRITRLNKYLSQDSLTSEIYRRTLNSLIIIYNIFGEGTDELLDYKITNENKNKLNSFKKVIGRLPDDIDFNEEVLEKLKCLCL